VQTFDWRCCFRRVVLTVTAILAVSSALPRTTAAQQDVLAAIDRTGSPRDDFFQYANGEWLKRHPIPDDQARWGVANLISDEVYSQIRRISENAAAKSARRGSAEQLIGDFWATGMDVATINRQGHSPLQPDLDRIDKIQSVADVIDASFSPDFESLGRRLAQWRASRPHLRAPIPEPLWAEAVMLARRHGVFETARTLRVGYDGLRRRVNQAPVSALPVPTFVELSHAPRSPAALWVLEFRGADGRSLRVQLPAMPLGDLATLARTV
jgi:hypothetical protein